jgi:Ran GTPase-activating protein (RanGAP) involved in mRNA processing and transport
MTKSAQTKYQQKYLRKVLKEIAKNDPTTTEVVLNNHPFQEETVATLTSSLVSNTHLRILYLHNCGINARGAHLLAYAIRNNSSIEHLWLNGNRVGSAGAEALANALRDNSTLTTLGLCDNDIGNHGGKRINESLKYNDVITDIFLEGNRMSDRLVEEIGRRCDRSLIEDCHQEHKLSCGGSPVEDYGDESTVMSSVTSSYTRRMLESIEEESEEDQEEEDSEDDDVSTVFDQDITSYAMADLQASRKKCDFLPKIRLFGRKFRIGKQQ